MLLPPPHYLQSWNLIIMHSSRALMLYRSELQFYTWIKPFILCWYTCANHKRVYLLTTCVIIHIITYNRWYIMQLTLLVCIPTYFGTIPMHCICHDNLHTILLRVLCHS